MKIIDDHEVSETEKKTRFIFGALFGVIVSVFIIYRFDLSTLASTLVSVVVILACGILALIHGDRFWIAIFGEGRKR